MTQPADQTPGVLTGIRVVEFAQNAAIPHCGRLLAGLGADVVKVEPPEGDAMRRLISLGEMESRAYALINPGKRSIAIDLGSPDSRTVVDALFEWADVALVAFKLPDLARYGIDWDQARTVNPRLIHLTHTALGPDGPDAHFGGYDALVQGRSGVGYVMNRSGKTAPQPTRPAINDFGSGFSAAFAVMAGLRHRDQTGEGQRIDTSLLGTAMSLGTPLLGRFRGDDELLDELDADIAIVQAAGLDFDAQRDLYESKVQAGAGVFQLYFRHYRTSDGLISIAGLTPGLIAKFHSVTGVGRPTETDTGAASFLAVVTQAEAVFSERTTAEWLEALRDAGYPCGPYNMPHQALPDPHAIENGYVVELEHPVFGAYTATGMPFQMEKATSQIRGPSPGFAVDTRQVLEEVGFDEQLIDGLIASGAVISR